MCEHFAKLCVQEEHPAWGLLADGPAVAVHAKKVVDASNATAILSVPLLPMILSAEQSVKYAIVCCFVHCRSDLLEVGQVVLAAAVGRPEAVLYDEGKAASYETVGALFGLCRHVSGDALVRL